MKNFKFENGLTFSGLSKENYIKLFNRLNSDLGLNNLQITEAGAFSSAMVLRVALGLSASGATLTSIIDDCRAGQLTTATMRILTNAGSSSSILVLADINKSSDELKNQLELADKVGVQIVQYSEDQLADTLEHIANCHALLLGIFDGELSNSKISEDLVNGINDIQTPVHCFEAPPGVDVDTGQKSGKILFSATTIVFGMPLLGLAEAKEYCGRTYLCDISVANNYYQEYSENLMNIFESQPVVQIFPDS